MSTQSIKIHTKCEKLERFDEIMMSVSDDYMKSVRFDIGKICMTKLKYLNLYYKTIFQNYCNHSNEDFDTITEKVFVKMAAKIKTL